LYLLSKQPTSNNLRKRFIDDQCNQQRWIDHQNNQQ
jgi:hypothetical protein